MLYENMDEKLLSKYYYRWKIFAQHFFNRVFLETQIINTLTATHVVSFTVICDVPVLTNVSRTRIVIHTLPNNIVELPDTKLA